jgi:hypothetical protein
MRLLGRDDAVITGVDDWTRPKKPDLHWKPGRSAMSLAEAWFSAGQAQPPRELVDLLESHQLTRGAVLEEGRPEFVTALPERGEGRNHDLWLRGSIPAGKLSVGIEAKADESFGDRIGEMVRKRRESGDPTRLPERADALVKLLFGPAAAADTAPWSELRYQLVTGAAGTLIQAGADGASVAVFVVHEFHTSSTRADRLAENLADYRRFVELLLPGQAAWEAGPLFGPVTLPAGGTMQLLVGRIVGDAKAP